VGVADPALSERMLGVLCANGVERVLVVHGDDGLDELTTTTTSTVWEFDGATARHWTLDPLALGLDRVAPADLVGGDPVTNAGYAGRVLGGERGPHRDIVVLNAAAGLLVGGAVDEIADGVDLAGAVLDDGRAAAALDRLVVASRAAVP
jgi:anthranilate phosphoribosyltransferase